MSTPLATASEQASGRDNVFRALVAMCRIVECVVSQFRGSMCASCPCWTARKVWERPSGGGGRCFVR
ncbi:hypothetical protein Taro_022553 [Colocasia esculenta]|uniref:Uncharacterized protein n=1 Tax=Colocasia esculenta TaxID=4460 RepID=A0A843V893_COLES|nr:hypothetical protein [Colocasia esculenta]